MLSSAMLFSLPVIMYHSISRYPHRLCLPPERFEEHCRILAEAGWRGISLAEAEDFFLKKKRLPPKSCLFTFDDGYLDNYVYAEPLLRRYGHQGVIFPVVGCLEEREGLRPNLDSCTLNTPEQNTTFLQRLDTAPTVTRAGTPVRSITFCSWKELQHMGQKGALAAAPHSMRHARVVRSLEIKGLLSPSNDKGFFSVPPYEILWGLPRFKLGYGLAGRAYMLVPELFDLIRRTVPQDMKEAKHFLRQPRNRKAVFDAIARLPRLGVLETERQYRSRIAEEFVQCRESFKQKLGIAPISFCWPWGAFNDIALEEARNAGFQIFFTTDKGANTFGSAIVKRFGNRKGTAEELLRHIRIASHAPFAKMYAGLYFLRAGRRKNAQDPYDE